MLGPAAAWPFPARSMRSRKVTRSSNRAFGSFRGSVVYTPATDVAFTMRAAATARDDEEFHAHRNVSQQAGETSKIPCVVVSGNEDGTAEGNDDFLHVNTVSTQKVMND